MKVKFENIPKEMELLYGEKQKYFLDKNPKAMIAVTKRQDKKIYVNDKFEELSEREKIAILYHERGHSNFYLWKFFFELKEFFFSLSILFLFFPLILIFINKLDILIFQIPNLFWILSIIFGFSFFVFFVSINYLLEIIADIYSASKTKDETLIKCINDEYKRRNKKSWWAKYITHPSPKLRKKIIKLILEF